MDRTPTIIPVLLGPTAVGKSALALELAERFSFEILSCDSRQIYCGLSIGTAKPTIEEQQRVPHHLIDILPPSEEYSAARWAADSAMVIEKLLAQGKKPLICGGTFFYLQALKEGLIPSIEPDPNFRTQCKEEELHKPGILHARLEILNPHRAAQLHPHDIQRIIRALYTVEHPQEESGEKYRSPYEFAIIKLSRTRDSLYQRINCRVEAMMEQGLLEEYLKLVDDGYTQEHPGMKCVGYQELFKYIEKQATLPEVVQDIQQHSRKYAKRQTTWLRNKETEAAEIDATTLSEAKLFAQVHEEYMRMGIC